MPSFAFNSIQSVSKKGGKVIHKVSIKKGKGYKSISKYHKGKLVSKVKKPLSNHHIETIKSGKFIPGLFNDCKNCKTRKAR
jgi:F0F1-type ATP synthase alpha subunit